MSIMPKVARLTRGHAGSMDEVRLALRKLRQSPQD